MTVKEVAKSVFGRNIRNGLIGFYEVDSNGNPKQIYPEYADELIETSGDLEVEDYKYVESKNVLVIELKKS